MEWKSIDTAPKDGTQFLAYDSRTKTMDVCYWWCEVGGAYPVQSDGEYGPDKDEFAYDWRDISHWMPLPSPPQR